MRTTAKLMDSDLNDDEILDHKKKKTNINIRQKKQYGKAFNII